MTSRHRRWHGDARDLAADITSTTLVIGLQSFAQATTLAGLVTSALNAARPTALVMFEQCEDPTPASASSNGVTWPGNSAWAIWVDLQL